MSTLCHHGIKGQKWGRRRYQKDDGSLTSAGRVRYDDGALKTKSASSGSRPNKTSKSQVKSDNVPPKSKPKGTSNSVPRKQPSKKKNPAKSVSNGKSKSKSVLSSIGKMAVANAMRTAEISSARSMAYGIVNNDIGSFTVGNMINRGIRSDIWD